MKINAREWSHTLYSASRGETCATSSSTEIPTRSAVRWRISRMSASVSTLSMPATFEYSRRTRSSTRLAPVARFRYASASPNTASYADVVACESHVNRSRPYPVSTTWVSIGMRWPLTSRFIMNTRVAGSAPPKTTSKHGPLLPPPLPPRLLVAGERRVDPEPLGQEEMADLDRPVFEVDELLGEVERVVGHHLEHREVLAGLPDVVDVQESHARLAERQWIRGRARLAADDPRLERIHAGLDEEDVIAPARDDRVALHARVAVLLEEREEVLAHRAVCKLLLERRRADEVVFLARRLPACVVDAERPEGRVAFRTRLAGEALLPKKLDLVFTLGHFRPPNERRPLKVLGGDAPSDGASGIFRTCTVRLSTRALLRLRRHALGRTAVDRVHLVVARRRVRRRRDGPRFRAVLIEPVWVCQRAHRDSRRRLHRVRHPDADDDDVALPAARASRCVGRDDPRVCIRQHHERILRLWRTGVGCRRHGARDRRWGDGGRVASRNGGPRDGRSLGSVPRVLDVRPDGPVRLRVLPVLRGARARCESSVPGASAAAMSLTRIDTVRAR